MSITYADIEKANKQLKLTPIKGKDYAEVNQRIKAFRMIYPDGFIKTEIAKYEDELIIMRATVGFYDNNMLPIIIGTGTAYEIKGSTRINSTSFIENCETSAVGRALGMAGFGIDTAIASAEELNNALEAQNDLNIPCQMCGKTVTPKEHDWSLRHFGGRILCRSCQQKASTE